MDFKDLIRTAVGKDFIAKSDSVLRFIVSYRGTEYKPYTGFEEAEQNLVGKGWGIIISALVIQAYCVISNFFWIVPITAIAATLVFSLLAFDRRTLASRLIEQAYGLVKRSDNHSFSEKKKIEELTRWAISASVASLFFTIQAFLFVIETIFTLDYLYS